MNITLSHHRSREMTVTELQEHHRHMINNLERLDSAEPLFTPEDRQRAQLTRKNLTASIRVIERDLVLMGARK